MHLARDSRLKKHRAIKITKGNSERGSQRRGAILTAGLPRSRDDAHRAQGVEINNDLRALSPPAATLSRSRVRVLFTFAGTALRINKNDNNDYCAPAVVKSSASSALMPCLIAPRDPPPVEGTSPAPLARSRAASVSTISSPRLRYRRGARDCRNVYEPGDKFAYARALACVSLAAVPRRPRARIAIDHRDERSREAISLNATPIADRTRVSRLFSHDVHRNRRSRYLKSTA